MKWQNNIVNICSPAVHGAVDCGLKSFKLEWRYHQFLFRFIAKGHLHRVSRQSGLLANDKGDNEMIPRAVHRSPGIYLTVKENPGKPQLGDYIR